MRILLFGATGSAGNSVLQACLSTPLVTEIRAISRRPLTKPHPKLTSIIHDNFLDFSPIAESFQNIDACLFCLGTSVTQISKDDYIKITHDFTLAAATQLKSQSPSAFFHYITGQGTNPDSRMFWSQIKSKTELELIQLVGADCFRPAFIDAKPSASVPKIYSIFFPLGRLFKSFPNLYIHGHDLAYGMLQATRENLRGRIFENREIRDLAARFPK